MKKIASVIFAAASGTIATQAAISDDLVAYYDFEQFASGNGASISNLVPGGIVATIVGNSPTAGFEGSASWNSIGESGAGNTSDRSTMLVGNAANFSRTTGGSTDRINLGISSTELWGEAPEAGSAITISAWFYAAVDPNQANSQRYYVFEDGTNTSQYDVSFGTSNQNATGSTFVYGSYNNSSSYTATNLSTNTWHHIIHVFEYDGTATGLSIYVNGDLQNQIPILVGGFPQFSEINLGNARDGQGRAWDGMMDEVAIWRRSLSALEVQGITNRGVEGVPLVTSIILNATPPDAGTLAGSGIYDSETEVAISAVPNPGYAFIGWEGDFVEQPSAFTFNVENSVFATAIFGPDMADDDNDGLSNYEEIMVYNTDPSNPDTDGDLIPDGDEIQITETNPNFADTELVNFVLQNLTSGNAGAIGLNTPRFNRNPVAGDVTLFLSLSGSADQVSWQDIDLTPQANIIPSSEGWMIRIPAPSQTTNSFIVVGDRQ